MQANLKESSADLRDFTKGWLSICKKKYLLVLTPAGGGLAEELGVKTLLFSHKAATASPGSGIDLLQQDQALQNDKIRQQFDP